MTYLEGQEPPGSYICTDSTGKLLDPVEAVFPIIKSLQDGTNNIHLVGTGFFISTSGIFVTAKHVIQDAFFIKDNVSVQKDALAMYQSFGNNNYLFRQFIQLNAAKKSDVGVGIAEPVLNKITKDTYQNKTTNLGKEIAINDEVFILCYAGSEVCNEKKSIHFRPSYFTGKIEEHYKEKGPFCKIGYPYYTTNIHLHPISSGAPVFNSKTGRVIGVACASYDSCTNFSAIVPISVVFSISLNNLLIHNRFFKELKIANLIDLGIISAI